MPFSLNLPAPLPNDGWRVKIFDDELPFEQPHVTIVRNAGDGLRKWRISLRDKKFMDKKPPAREVDDDVIEAIENNWKTLKDEWNDRYPNNPV